MQKLLVLIVVVILIVIIVVALSNATRSERVRSSNPPPQVERPKAEKPKVSRPKAAKSVSGSCGAPTQRGECFYTPTTAGPNLYDIQYLVSDPNAATPSTYTDAALINPWGLAHAPDGPWNVVNNGPSLATEYTGDGEPYPIGSPVTVTIGSGTGPTGNVFNPFAWTHPDEFLITSGISVPAIFFYAAEDGTVWGWNSSLLPTQAVLVINNTQSGAVYKGITMLEYGGARYLYVTNFRTGLVEIYDSTYVLVTTFTDPNLAANCPLSNQCYAPFNIQAHCENLYVTFALQDANHEDDVSGPGNGYVVVFDGAGNLITRLISGGNLNSPWGLAWSPKCFGAFGGCLLVANFGDGNINAYNTFTGALIGTLREYSTNLPVVIDGLWGIQFGNGNLSGSKKNLYFTAGTNGETSGTFGYIKTH